MFEYRRVEATKYDKDSFITVKPESFGSTGAIGTIEAFHPYGFAGRPDDKDSNGAAGALIDIDGPQGYAWIMNDGRAQSLLPEILAGESFQYGAFGNFVRCHRDGRVSLFTTDDGTVNGRTIAMTIGPTGMVYNSPWGNMKLDATGFHVLHSSGARIDLGACGGLPAPLSALASYLKLSAALVQIEGSAVSLGATGGVGAPAAKGDAVVTVLGAISSALTAIEAALSATTAIPGANAVMAGPVADAVAAITAAQTAITTGAAAIPSSSAMVT